MRALALAAHVGLMALVVIWEAWWAPATPVARGFWIALKLVPLAVVLPWLVRGGARAHLAAALLLLLYFCEGVTSAYSAVRAGAAGTLAYGAAEAALSMLFIVTASVYVRLNGSRAGARTES